MIGPDRAADAGPDRRLMAIAALLCVAALLPTLSYRMGPDHGAFAYMGSALLEGRWPYIHTWENDFPGLVFVQAAEIALLGRSIAMFRVFDLLVQLGNALLVLNLAVRCGVSRSGALLSAVLFCLIYQNYGPWNTAQREGFGLILILGGYWLFFTASRRPAWLTALGIGIGMGVAVSIKPTLLALAGFYVPLVFRLRDRHSWMPTLLALAGTALPMAIVAVVYWRKGALTQLYEACLGYQAMYTSVLRGTDPLLAYWMDKLGRMGRNSVVLPLAYVPFLFAGTHRLERRMVWVAYLGSAFAVFVQGTFAGYHYLPGLGVGAVLIGSMFSLTVGWFIQVAPLPSSARRLLAPSLVALLLMAAAPAYIQWENVNRLITRQFLNRPVPGEFRISTVFDFTEDYDVAEHIRLRTAPGDPIQVWGYESLVYYLAERQASSRFQQMQPLVMTLPGIGLAPMQEAFRDEFLHDVTRRPPVYIAVVRGDGWWWAPDSRPAESLLDDFPQWKQIIEHRYRHETTIGRFVVYRLVEPREAMWAPIQP